MKPFHVNMNAGSQFDSWRIFFLSDWIKLHKRWKAIWEVLMFHLLNSEHHVWYVCLNLRQTSMQCENQIFCCWICFVIEQKVNDAALYMGLTLVFILVGLIFLRLFYTKLACFRWCSCCNFSGCDVPNFGSIIIYVHNIFVCLFSAL